MIDWEGARGGGGEVVSEGDGEGVCYGVDTAVAAPEVLQAAVAGAESPFAGVEGTGEVVG